MAGVEPASTELQSVAYATRPHHQEHPEGAEYPPRESNPDTPTKGYLDLSQARLPVPPDGRGAESGGFEPPNPEGSRLSKPLR